jgi:osmotically inducible protein OsmC
MIKRNANAIWEGDLIKGKGSFTVGSGALSGKYSFSTRFEEEPGTNPEELIGAAHAGCFSMALSADLSKAGYTVDEIKTEAQVSMEKKETGFEITGIKLVTMARVADIDMESFSKIASGTKENCPVSKALKAVPVQLEAHLLKK